MKYKDPSLKLITFVFRLRQFSEKNTLNHSFLHVRIVVSREKSYLDIKCAEICHEFRTENEADCDIRLGKMYLFVLIGELELPASSGEILEKKLLQQTMQNSSF